MRTAIHRQAGFGMVAAVAALIGVSVLFLAIFLLSNSGKPSTGNQQQTNQQQTPTETTSTEPPYIRIPENSFIYSNSKYKFMFAYPNSFDKLIENTDSNGTVLSRAESIPADQKPVGNTGAFLTGRLGAYVYSKDDFKIIVDDPNVFVGPTKTGNDTTWKVVSVDKTDKDISIGDSYDVDVIKSQTSISVFSLPRKTDNTLVGRLVFEAGDYYVLIVLPYVSKPSGGTLTDSDVAAYNIIITNIAKTVRLQATSSTTGSSSPTSSDSSGSGSSTSDSTASSSDSSSSDSTSATSSSSSSSDSNYGDSSHSSN